jgi:toxin FitB
MIVLDTNVVSEAFRVRPSERVRAWFDAQNPLDLFLCTPVLAELRFGAERLDKSPARTRLDQLIEQIEQREFADRILPVDRGAAHEFGRLVARRNRLGRPITTMDVLIASVALSQRAALATRDTNDFTDLGLDVINPFEPSAER